MHQLVMENICFKMIKHRITCVDSVQCAGVSLRLLYLVSFELTIEMRTPPLSLPDLNFKTIKLVALECSYRTSITDGRVSFHVGHWSTSNAGPNAHIYISK